MEKWLHQHQDMAMHAPPGAPGIEVLANQVDDNVAVLHETGHRIRVEQLKFLHGCNEIEAGASTS